MKVFKELTIAIPTAKRNEFVSSLENHLPTGWSRDKEAEAYSSKLGSREHIYIGCEEKGERKSALVALVPKEGVGYFVANIVPKRSGQLTYDEYNRILDDFAISCISPLEKALGLTITRSFDTVTLEKWVSDDTANKLRQFSGLANKSTGTSHPMDKERWYDFVIAVVTKEESLDTSILSRWLTEEEGWDDDVAHKMSIEYEQEVGLLKQYLGK